MFCSYGPSGLKSRLEESREECEGLEEALQRERTLAVRLKQSLKDARQQNQYDHLGRGGAFGFIADMDSEGVERATLQLQRLQQQVLQHDLISSI